MDPSRRRSAARKWVVAFLVLAGLALPVSAASAGTIPDTKLGWSSCLWPAGKTITVAVDPAFALPGGASDRLNEAIVRWDGVLRTSRRGGDVVRVGDGAADIVVQYRALEGTDTSEVLGETYLERAGDPGFTTNIGVCPDRRPAAFGMQAVQIRIAPRNDWFTGDDNSTTNWQNCGGSTFRAFNPGLCTPTVDFGSTMTHELGHALVFYHPQTLDQIDNIPVNRTDSASAQAKCVEASGEFPPQATMCSGQGQWRAEQRTLETWDVETMHRAYDQ
ncbi:MAG: hypothetical protein QOD57_3405 [Actinomycetota bacterium]|jgi:hypothetical protein|nr:hypothetical protein [Actinomycetota bacterium]MDQ1505678.1 hypothetical protein [Actinomycetota bacterium]